MPSTAEGHRLTLEEYYSVNARYRTHSYTRHYRHRHARPVRNPVDAMGSYGSTGFHTQKAVVFPYATGTSILDAYTGREPIISASSCAYPVQLWPVSTAYMRWEGLRLPD